MVRLSSTRRKTKVAKSSLLRLQEEPQLVRAKADLPFLVSRLRVRRRDSVAWEAGGELVWGRALGEGKWDLLREEVRGS